MITLIIQNLKNKIELDLTIM